MSLEKNWLWYGISDICYQRVKPKLRDICVWADGRQLLTAPHQDLISHPTLQTKEAFCSHAVALDQASLTILCSSNSSYFSHTNQSIISHKQSLSKPPFHKLSESTNHQVHHLFFTAQELCWNLSHRGLSHGLMRAHETPTCLPSCPTLVCPLTTVLMLSSSRLVKGKTHINKDTSGQITRVIR